MKPDEVHDKVIEHETLIKSILETQKESSLIQKQTQLTMQEHAKENNVSELIIVSKIGKLNGKIKYIMGILLFVGVLLAWAGIAMKQSNSDNGQRIVIELDKETSSKLLEALKK